MSKRTIIKNVLFLLMLVIFVLYAWIRVENSQFIREPRTGFGDTHEFIDAASVPVFSESFWISIRPPVVPLVYKLMGVNLQKIFQFQLWFSILVWSFLGFTATSVLRSYPIKIATFFGVLVFSLSEEIIMWDYIILGDSISISIMVLFLASALLLLSKWGRFRFYFLVVTATLFAFVRDDFAFYILMSGTILLMLLLRTKNWKRPFLVSVVFVVLFLGSNALSSKSLRWYRPVLNTISLRILPNSQYLAYFESRGMPVNEALLERSGKHLHADNNALVEDSRLEKFRSWVQDNGKREYINFLWFFKADAFQSVFDDAKIIFSPNVYYYTATRFRAIISDARIDELLFPMRFGFLLFLVANLIATACSVVAFYERKAVWVVPLSLILLTYPQALLVWNADANDMARHALYHNVMLRLGVWLLAFFVIDFVVEKVNYKFQFLLRETTTREQV